MAVEVPSEEQGVTASHQAPQPRAPVQEKGVPMTSGCENQQGFYLQVRGRLLETQAVLLKDPCRAFLAHNSLTLSPSTGTAAQKVPGTFMGGTKLTSFGTGRAGIRAAFSWDGNAGRHHHSFIEPSLHTASPHRWAPNLSLC